MTKFIHLRKGTLFGELSPKGGATIAYDFDPETRVVAFVAAQCSRDAHYNKKVGRAVSGGRLRKYGGEKLNVPEGSSVADTVLNRFFGEE